MKREPHLVESDKGDSVLSSLTDEDAYEYATRNLKYNNLIVSIGKTPLCGLTSEQIKYLHILSMRVLDPEQEKSEYSGLDKLFEILQRSGKGKSVRDIFNLPSTPPTGILRNDKSFPFPGDLSIRNTSPTRTFHFYGRVNKAGYFHPSPEVNPKFTESCYRRLLEFVNTH